jgi:hypothetical protein
VEWPVTARLLKSSGQGGGGGKEERGLWACVIGAARNALSLRGYLGHVLAVIADRLVKRVANTLSWNIGEKLAYRTSILLCCEGMASPAGRRPYERRQECGVCIELVRFLRVPRWADAALLGSAPVSPESSPNLI